MSEDMITWSGDEDRQNAFASYSENIDSYGGLGKSSAYHRDFLNIEPNRSVRPQFSKRDYYAFREGERVPSNQKRIIKMCMDAYDKVGIIRNIVDLMGDFGSQGISLVHADRTAERFFKQWFKKVDGKERSERFLNNLYRTGNVVVYRSNASITPELNTFMKSVGNDIKVELPNVTRNVIPFRYNFFNPMSVNMKDSGLSLFVGSKRFSISNSVISDVYKKGHIPQEILKTLPPAARRSIENGDKEIPLEPERLSVHYYKKDDWQVWANPMIYAILDDIIMLEKMRLADLSALDGAISNIRLWTLGSLDHKILPNKAAINKLRDILASNAGGGTMELVWGPELSYTESNSQVYKFLGSEKYNSVLNSIYAGLGVPPTLTGMAGNGGGFTNNFISLKTLVERLQYGRSLLVNFWQKEIEVVRKAMGFRRPAYVQFDQMNLSDDTAEKNLLLQLADRDIISHETILERFKEIPTVEKIRLKREMKSRDRDDSPSKAGPYHNPQHDHEIEKIALTKDLLDDEYLEDKGLPLKEIQVDVKPEKPQEPSSPRIEERQDMPSENNGRPKNSIDTEPRKQRVEKPRSTPGLADLIDWSQDSYNKISECVTMAFLKANNKKNLRQVTKAELFDVERIKFDVLTNLDLLCEVNDNVIHQHLASASLTPTSFKTLLSDKDIDINDMSIESYRKKAVSCFVEYAMK
mgnify:FL=1|tara:strand:- start:9870 stop:11954 length:2085 start_codon:yes stop_codon:yes gene_type:complete